jgi:hypothetical protein
VSGRAYPKVGDVLYDADGRELSVHGVFPGDRLGREVRGQLVNAAGDLTRDYACDQRTWVAVWRDRLPLATFRA